MPWSTTLSQLYFNQARKMKEEKRYVSTFGCTAGGTFRGQKSLFLSVMFCFLVSYGLLGVTQVWVKYHFKTDQGIRNLPAQEADAITGTNPDHAIQDLYNAIAEGNAPSWTVYVQV